MFGGIVLVDVRYLDAHIESYERFHVYREGAVRRIAHGVRILAQCRAVDHGLDAVVGMTDMYARRFIGKDQMSFAVPYSLYRRMEADVDGSFLVKEKFIDQMSKCI